MISSSWKPSGWTVPSPYHHSVWSMKTKTPSFTKASAESSPQARDRENTKVRHFENPLIRKSFYTP